METAQKIKEKNMNNRFIPNYHLSDRGKGSIRFLLKKKQVKEVKVYKCLTCPALIKRNKYCKPCSANTREVVYWKF